MTIGERNIPVLMVRDTLDNLPPLSLPKTLTLRWFQTGDERNWLELHRVAEPYRAISSKLYAREFGNDVQRLSQRQCFLCDTAGNVIGTASAWFDDFFNDSTYGRVHWVAVHPEWQGQGLGKALTIAVCRRLHELGYSRAFLRTSSARTRAIRMYLGLGFEPFSRNTEEKDAWNDLLKTLHTT